MSDREKVRCKKCKRLKALPSSDSTAFQLNGWFCVYCGNFVRNEEAESERTRPLDRV